MGYFSSFVFAFDFFQFISDGHKFPVLCMDISYDSTTIITAGADRNIKIWGKVDLEIVAVCVSCGFRFIVCVCTEEEEHTHNPWRCY